MHLNEFLGQVQHAGRMRSMDEAMRATRATLTTLDHMRAQLPADYRRLFDAGSEGGMEGGMDSGMESGKEGTT
jgi:uncharacterized protein (DUF2267 family)